MADQDRAARAVGEMSGQPCGYEWTHGDVCGSGEGAPIHHGVGILGYPSHPYTPLERRTGKDRRRGQVAAQAVIDLLANHEHPLRGVPREYEPGNLVCDECGYETRTDAALAAAPQAAPADGGPYSFEPLTGDGWAINGPGEQERHGDWQADGYGLAIALDRETAVLIVDALNRAASADGALREALDAAALYILASPAVSGPVQEEDRRQVIELLDRALAAADAAPERTLPSVEELEAALEAVDRSGFFERNKVWVGARFYGDALAGAILAALRAEATK